MLKHLHLKILSLLLAILFWLAIVSLENAFYKVPQEIPVQVFNQSQELALSSQLGGVTLTVRAQDKLVLRGLAQGDFEAYVDLRNVGAGTSFLPVSVTSRNAQVNVVKVEPTEVEVTLEPVREKSVVVGTEISGRPAVGFSLDSAKLSKDSVVVKGAVSVVAKIGMIKAQVKLDGTERSSMIKTVEVKVFDKGGAPLEGLTFEPTDLSVSLTISEVQSSKQVGVKTNISGSVANVTIKKIEVTPAVVSLTGPREVLSGINFVETEALDVKDFGSGGEKEVELILPPGVKLADGQSNTVKVRVEVEKPQGQ